MSYLPSVQSYLGVITTGCQYPGYGPSSFSGQLQAMCRRVMYARDAMAGAQAVYVNYSGSTEAGPGATRTISASIEYPVGTFNRITFGGSNTGTITDGGQVISDQFGAWGPPRGAKFTIYTWQSSTAGILAYATTRLVDGMVGASTTTDLTGSGGSIAANDFTYGPIAIIGATSRPSIFIMGDSRTESSYMGPTVNYNGNLARSLGTATAFINTAVFGESLYTAVTSSTKRRSFVQYCSHVAISYGINTLTSDTAANGLSQLTQLAGLMGNRPVFASTIEPYTSSASASITSLTQTGGVATATLASPVTLTSGYSVTIAGATPSAYNGSKVITVVDSTHFTFSIAGGTTSPATGTLTYNDAWGSLENQVIDPVAGLAAKIFTFNDGIRSGLSGLHGFFDTARVAASSSDQNKWIVPGYTTDGLHGTARFSVTLQGSGVVNPAVFGNMGNVPPLG